MTQTKWLAVIPGQFRFSMGTKVKQVQNEPELGSRWAYRSACGLLQHWHKKTHCKAGS
jgi:hypothetical protein